MKLKQKKNDKTQKSVNTDSPKPVKDGTKMCSLNCHNNIRSFFKSGLSIAPEKVNGSPDYRLRFQIRFLLLHYFQ